MSIVEKIKEIFQSWFGLGRMNDSNMAIAASAQDQAPLDLKRAPEDPEDQNKKEAQEIKEGQDNVKEPEKPVEEPKAEEQKPADATIQLQNEQKVFDARDEGYDPPVDTPYGAFKKPFTIPRELAIEFELQHPEGVTYLQVRKQAAELPLVSEPCCIRDAKVEIHFNGHLIYAGDQRTPARGTQDAQTESAAANVKGDGCSDCCCELPPVPTPNYCFTYTNCDDCAYLTLSIRTGGVEEEPNDFHTAALVDGESSDCGCGSSDDSYDPKKYDEIYYIGFYPGYEPDACDCPIVEVCTNVIFAEHLADFSSRFQINDFTDIVADSAEFEGSSRRTTFEDDCGVCWSIYRFEPDTQLVPPVELEHVKSSGYYLLPLCISQVRTETICYVSLETFVPTMTEDDGESSGTTTTIDYYDGLYHKEIENKTTNSISDDIELKTTERYNDFIKFTVLEIEGNVVLSMNYSQSYAYENEDYVNGEFWNNYVDNSYNLILDIDDSFSVCDNTINAFITCDPIQGLLTQLFESFHASYVNEVVTNGGIASITDAEIKDASFAVLTALFQQGEGVFRDEQGNLFKLNIDGMLSDLGTFSVLGAVQNNTSLTNANLVAGGDQATSTPLEVEFCGPIVGRFAEWQSYTGCDSAYGNPFQYVNDNLKVSYIQAGDTKYIEFEYWNLSNYVGSGYYAGYKEFFRICVDDLEYNPETIVIDAQKLFEEYYNNGYVDFYNLFYNTDDSAIHIIDTDGNAFEIGDGEYDEQTGLTCSFSLEPTEKKCECNAEPKKEEYCQQDISYVIDGEVAVTYLDQFLDMDFISCEGNSFVTVNWYYNPSLNGYGSDLPNPADCFNFPILQGNAILEIDSKYQALFQDCECPIDRVVLPESVLNLFEDIYNCQTTSNDFYDYIGYDIFDILDATNAPFITECGVGFVIDNGELVPLCEMPNIFTDENDLLEYDFVTNSFEDAKTAASAGEGLSLRELIILSNHYTFNEGVKNMICLEEGEYVLSLTSGTNDEDYGDLDVTKDLIIFGAGKEASVIDANEIDRVIENKTNSELTLLALTVRGGEISNDSGAGILSQGVLHLDDVIVMDNSAQYVGGTLNGGAVYMREGTIKDSEIKNNEATAETVQGGGLYVVNGTITDSMIHSNDIFADEIYGAGVLLEQKSEISNSTIYNNDGSANNALIAKALYGGGLLIGQNSDGSQVINVTIDNNSLTHIGGVGTSTNGAGLYDMGSNSFLSNLTVTSNESNGSAGGSAVVLSGNGAILQSSIILGNTDNSGNNNEDLKIMGTGVSGTHNISESFDLGSSTVAVTSSTYSDEFGANSLADNGGATWTVALEESTSLAINSGLAGAPGAADATADQRHVPYVAVPDVGAYESPVLV